jgi:hypothetical protein
MMAPPPQRSSSLLGWLREQHPQIEDESDPSETAPLTDPAIEPAIIKHRKPSSDDL